MKRWIIALSMTLGLSITSCVSITPELITALSADKASFCMNSDIRGGVGTLLTPGGGYGQSTLSFCRSNQSSAKISLQPDGTISIVHGDK